MSLPEAFLAINPWAVLVAGIVHMVTGLIWYLPNVFGKQWSKLTGKDLSPARQWLPVGVLGHIAMVLVLSVLLRLSSVTSVPGGLIVAGLVWIGFIVPLEVGELIWEKIAFRLFLIRIAEHLVALGLACIILSIWR